MIFEFEDVSVRDAYFALWDALDGTQPCADDPDDWVENWTGRPIPDEVAERKCAGCKFLEECRTYARLAGEEHGIWGGETPEMRKRA
jgi:hypothetical protein